MLRHHHSATSKRDQHEGHESHHASLILLGDAIKQRRATARPGEAIFRIGQMDEIRILQSSSMGYGNIGAEFIKRGLELDPHIIVGQGTSTDPGPYYLGQDDIYGYVGKENKKRDISLLLCAARQAEIPFVFSGGSPSGSDAQLEGILRIVHEIASEKGLKFSATVISGEIDKAWLKRQIRAGKRAKRLINTPRLDEDLTEDAVDGCKRIVAQMGFEPIMKGLQTGTHGVIAGRSLDIGLYMAYPLLHGFDIGLTAHMAKTIECGALCATPPINENVFVTLRRDHFLVRTLNDARKCTPGSVAAHAFYERPDIAREENPGGYLDITPARYTQHDERSVRVEGARWVKQPYTIKLEGAKQIGYRTITIAGLRDPNLIKAIDPLIDWARGRANEKFSGVDFSAHFHQYGKNAVLGEVDTARGWPVHEIGLVISIVAPTQAQATTICAFIRGQLHFGDFTGRTSTAGNIATLFSPAEIEMGAAFVWGIWHSLTIDDPCEPFPMRTMQFPNPDWS